MANVMVLENVLASLALIESSVIHVPRIFLDFHSVEVSFFSSIFLKLMFLLFTIYLFFSIFLELMLFSLNCLSYVFIDCKCDGDGSLDGKCDDAGKCSCKTGFDGVKCNTCAKNFFGFPRCRGIFFSSIFLKLMLFSLYYLSYVFYRVYL